MRRLPVFAVTPAADLEKRRLLFSSLGSALGVAFVEHPHEQGRKPDGIILFRKERTPVPEGAIPSMVILAPQTAASPLTQQVVLADSPLLGPLLSGALLSERLAAPLSPIPWNDGDIVLAHAEGRPVWVRERQNSTGTEVVSTSVQELSPEEILKDRLSDGKAFGLLPLIHFVRSVLGQRGYTPPGLRATFIVDDPNLRTFSYGCIHFPTLVTLARTHNFHVALATIPLDMWWISMAMKKFAREESRRISLAIHGNNHLHRELNRPVQFNEDLDLVGQALRRVGGFERRFGIPVSRVMVPPHGMCSRAMLGALRALGLDAVCVSRPTPWVPHRSPREILDGNLLQRWHPADGVDGMAILHRQKTLEDFRFNALLGQPLILYFHHNDFAPGYDWLCDLARTINRFGDVRWESLGEITRSNYDVRKEGTCIFLRAFSRTIDLPIPAGIDTVVIESPQSLGWVPGTMVSTESGMIPMGDTDTGYATDPIAVTSDTILHFSLRDPESSGSSRMGEPPFRFRPVLRRALTETRDRVYPLLRAPRR